MISENNGSGGTTREMDIPPSQQLVGLLKKRVGKFLGLLPTVLNEEDERTVHDLRACSRRLQEVVVSLFPKPRPREARSVLRVMRRSRKALGGWRDCDVWLSIVEKKMRRLRKPDERQAWDVVGAYVLNRRQRAIRRARRKLANRKLFMLAQIARKLVDQDQQVSVTKNSSNVLPGALLDAYSEWKAALLKANETSDPSDLHALRIQTKRLRYRVELPLDLGCENAAPALKILEVLQDRFGRWNDRRSLTRITAEALADPSLLQKRPEVAKLLLRSLLRDRSKGLDEIRSLQEAANEASTLLEAWVKEFSAVPLHHEPPQP
jgi:CHAD domain-containing protein